MSVASTKLVMVHTRDSCRTETNMSMLPLNTKHLRDEEIMYCSNSVGAPIARQSFEVGVFSFLRGGQAKNED